MAPAGQGFGQSAEDALALGHAMQKYGVTPAALRAFEGARWRRVAKVAETEQVGPLLPQRLRAPRIHRVMCLCTPGHPSSQPATAAAAALHAPASSPDARG